MALDFELAPVSHQKYLYLLSVFVTLRSNSRQIYECGSAKLMHEGIFWPAWYWVGRVYPLSDSKLD